MNIYLHFLTCGTNSIKTYFSCVINKMPILQFGVLFFISAIKQMQIFCKSRSCTMDYSIIAIVIQLIFWKGSFPSTTPPSLARWLLHCGR